MLARVLICLVLLSGLAWAGESTPNVGAAGFQPTTAHPFGFRGDGTGRYTEATPPLEWSVKKNVRWKTAVGKSYSSPTLTDKLIFVTAEPNLLVCLNRADGSEKWQAEIKPTDLADEKSQTAAKEYTLPEPGSGMMAATPLTDGKAVYVACSNGIFKAFDLEGKPKWVIYIDAEQNTSYGRSSTPILVDGKLILSMTNLYAFDPETGKQLWVNTDAKSAYGTPTVLKSGALNLIVTPGGDVVNAVDGKTLNTGIGRCSNPSPVVSDGVVFFADNAIKAVRLNAAFKDEEVWSNEIKGDVFGSPLVHNGLMYMATGMGQLCAYDVNGKGTPDPVINARELFPDEAGGEPLIYSSLSLAGNHLFLSTLRGETLVFEATKEAKQVGKNVLPEGGGGTPIFSGKEVFIRDGKNLFCIGE